MIQYNTKLYQESFMKIFKSTTLIFLLGLTVFTEGYAEEWPVEAKIQMKTAGASLSAAKTIDERVTAMRNIEQITAAYPNIVEARLIARLTGEKATQEAGAQKMLEALSELASIGQITDTETLGNIITPLLSTIGEMQENNTLLPEMAIQLDAAIKKLDVSAKKAGLPTLTESIIAQASGSTELANKITDSISKISSLAQMAQSTSNLKKMNEDATKKYIEDNVYFSMLPPGARVVFRDVLVYNNEMYGEATNALNLVSEAMETGRFNNKASAEIEKRLNVLSKGPWSSSTVSDFFKDLCKKIPIAGEWCDDLFEVFASVDCKSINCDCANVGGGLMRGPLIVQCKLHEDGIISTCKEKNIIGSCLSGVSGPAASPK